MLGGEKMSTNSDNEPLLGAAEIEALEIIAGSSGRALDYLQIEEDETIRPLLLRFPILQELLKIRMDQTEELESHYTRLYNQAIKDVLGPKEYGSIGTSVTVFLMHLELRDGTSADKETLQRINTRIQELYMQETGYNSPLNS